MNKKPKSPEKNTEKITTLLDKAKQSYLTFFKVRLQSDFVKSDRFKYLISYVYEHLRKIILYPVGKVKFWHSLILQVKESGLSEPTDRNPYQMCFDWFLEIIQYGFIGLLIYTFIFGFEGYYRALQLMLLFGLCRWVMLDIIGHIRLKIG